MKKTIFTGAGVAIITPFNEDLSVNYEKLGEIIEQQIAGKTDCIVICGTTGEAATLTDEEHKECIRYTVEKVNGRIPVIAGTGGNDTAYSLQLSQYAKDVGADAILLVTPYYNKTTQQGLIKHFGYIAENVDIPIFLYNVPSRTGLNIAPSTYKALSKYENIVAVKEASGNISQIAQIAAMCGDDLAIYSGNDDQITPILSLGGKGVISVLSNVMPEETHNICQLYFEGKTSESTALQLKLLNFINSLFCEVNPIPVKAAMNMLGMDVGSLRMPLCDISESGKETLKKAMTEIGLLK